MDLSYVALLLIALFSAFGLGILAHTVWLRSKNRLLANQTALPEIDIIDQAAGDRDRSQSGSVFTVLMVGLGMAAALSIATYQILAGPVASVARVTQHNLAKNQMITINRIALMDAVLQPSNGDCDSDGYIEPRPWRDTTGQKPTNGGLLPLAMGAPTTDPWMSDYGYCVWDVGTISADAGCGGATGRLNGADNPVSGDARTLTVMAVISAGPDRQFQTTCNAYVDATTDLITVAANSDDLVQRYTYAEAAASGGGEGLWLLKSGDPGTATISRNIEVGGGGLVQATAVTTTGRMIAGDGLRVGTDADVTDGECNDTNKGLMRYKSADDVVQFCAGTALGWIDAGASGGGSGGIDDLSDAIASTANRNIFLGENAGDSTTTAVNNIALGINALTSLTSGQSNIAIGSHNWGDALDSLTTGNENVAIGAMTMTGLTTGSQNIGIGYGAGDGLTTGTSNVAIGSGSMIYMGGGATTNVAVGNQAMQGNGGDAGFNVAVGVNALRRVTTGANNVFMGYEAGDDITTGGGNVGIGFWALSTQTTANNNTAVGIGALAANTSGTPNTAVGAHTLYANTTGNGNVAIGGGDNSSGATSAALRANTTGSNNVAIGVGALQANTVGNHNIAMGSGALSSSTGQWYNVAIGFDALRSTTVQGNMAVGTRALSSNTSGARNTALGLNALQSHPSGGSNTAIGYAAMNIGNAGSQNTAVGPRALFQNTGNNNTGVGSYVMWGNTTGSRNIAIGGGLESSGGDGAALYSNTTASDNIAIGVAALRATTVSGNNVAIGSYALSANTGTPNVAVGAHALRNNTTGVRNVAIGGGSDVGGGNSGALLSNTTGSGNTAVGSGALRANTTGQFNVAVGQNALTVGTSSQNTAIGTSALLNTTAASGNTAVGFSALSINETGSNNTAVGWGTGSDGPVNLTNTTAIGYNAKVSSSNTIRLGNTAVTAITGQVDFTFPSDRRDKHDIADSDLGLDFIMGLRPVSYRLNNGSGRLDYGFIAQEIEEALAGRETNMITRQNDERGSYLFRSSDMLGPMVKAMQETNARIDALEAPSAVPPLPVWLLLLIAGAAVSVIYASCYVVFTHPRSQRKA